MIVLIAILWLGLVVSYSRCLKNCRRCNCRKLEYINIIYIYIYIYIYINIYIYIYIYIYFSINWVYIFSLSLPLSFPSSHKIPLYCIRIVYKFLKYIIYSRWYLVFASMDSYLLSGHPINFCKVNSQLIHKRT